MKNMKKILRLFVIKLAFVLLIVISSFSFSGCSSSYYNFNFQAPALNEYQIPALTLSRDDINPMIDYSTIENEIQTTILSAHVRITNIGYNYKSIFTKMNHFLGSGAIFYSNDSYYYALTNYHVIEQNRYYNHQLFKVTDYLNQNYDGFIYEGSASETLDLAIIVFPKENTSLHVLKLRQSNMTSPTSVIAIGEPRGERNVISHGSILRYVSSTITNQYDEARVIPFLVIAHSAPTDSGSSGGMLINYHYELVGLNFAKSVDINNPDGYAIPVEIILNHLDDFMTLHYPLD